MSTRCKRALTGVSWNAYQGRKNTNGTKSSAAITLIHELGHQYLMLKGDESHTNKTEDIQYENSADAKDITSIENVVAGELGNNEGRREDHEGGQFWTSGPTSLNETSGIPDRAKEIKKDALRTGLTAVMNIYARNYTNKKERREYKRETRKRINKAVSNVD